MLYQECRGCANTLSTIGTQHGSSSQQKHKKGTLSNKYKFNEKEKFPTTNTAIAQVQVQADRSDRSLRIRSSGTSRRQKTKRNRLLRRGVFSRSRARPPADTHQRKRPPPTPVTTRPAHHVYQSRSEDLQDQVLAVPHCREGSWPQAGAQPERLVRAYGGVRGELLVLDRQQDLGRPLGGELAVRLPARTQEVHQGHQDGVRGHQEAGRAEGAHRVPQGGNGTVVRSLVIFTTRKINKDRENRLGAFLLGGSQQPCRESATGVHGCRQQWNPRGVEGGVPVRGAGWRLVGDERHGVYLRPFLRRFHTFFGGGG